MVDRILDRTDTAVNWNLSNPVLKYGERGIDSTAKKTKVGDGVTPWRSLGWWTPVLETNIEAKVKQYAPVASATSGYPRTIVQGMSAAFTGQNATNVQPFFDATNQAVNLTAGKTYLLEGTIIMTRGAGTTSHTIATMFGGTATFTNFGYTCDCRNGAYAAGTPIRPYINHYQGTAPSTAITVDVASTTTDSTTFVFRGKFIVSAGGTLIPQFQYSAAPGGAPVIDHSSWMAYTLLN